MPVKSVDGKPDPRFIACSLGITNTCKSGGKRPFPPPETVMNGFVTINAYAHVLNTRLLKPDGNIQRNKRAIGRENWPEPMVAGKLN